MIKSAHKKVTGRTALYSVKANALFYVVDSMVGILYISVIPYDLA